MPARRKYALELTSETIPTFFEDLGRAQRALSVLASIQYHTEDELKSGIGYNVSVTRNIRKHYAVENFLSIWIGNNIQEILTSAEEDIAQFEIKYNIKLRRPEIKRTLPSVEVKE